jgi:hypothetical protein
MASTTSSWSDLAIPGKNEATPNRQGEAAEKVSRRSSDFGVHHQSRTIRGVPADGWVKAKAFKASQSDPDTIEMVANRSDPGTKENGGQRI